MQVESQSAVSSATGSWRSPGWGSGGKTLEKFGLFKSGGQINSLKVVSTTFLLVWLVYLTGSTCELSKNVFYFTSKALFILEIIKF